MDGKIALVTGANSGLGLATAQALAARGASVVMVCRDRAKGEAARQAIQHRNRNSTVDLMIADLSSQQDIRHLATEFKSKYSALHVLVNNAAVFKKSREVNRDGLEMMFATNHLSHFLLTLLLLDTLKASAPAAVFTLTAPSSFEPNFDDLQSERSFSSIEAFGASKTMNLLFTFALARRLENTGVTVNAYDPGTARTNLMHGASIVLRVATMLYNLGATTPEKAVQGLVELAVTNANGATGRLFTGTQPAEAPAYTRDEQAQDRLWAASEQLVGWTNSGAPSAIA